MSCLQTMDAFYENVVGSKGAAFFAVCRGKVGGRGNSLWTCMIEPLIYRLQRRYDTYS